MPPRLITTNYPGCYPHDCNTCDTPPCKYRKLSNTELSGLNQHPRPNGPGDKSPASAASLPSLDATPRHQAPTEAQRPTKARRRAGGPSALAHLVHEEVHQLCIHLTAYCYEDSPDLPNIRKVIRRSMHKAILEALSNYHAPNDPDRPE